MVVVVSARIASTIGMHTPEATIALIRPGHVGAPAQPSLDELKGDGELISRAGL